MIAKIICYALNGLDGIPVEVETDVNKGVPSYEMVGLPDTAVKESKERVRSALKNSGMLFPMNKITVSLEAQKSIAKKYLTIQQCQQEAVKKLDTLISQKVSV